MLAIETETLKGQMATKNAEAPGWNAQSGSRLSTQGDYMYKEVGA